WLYRFRSQALLVLYSVALHLGEGRNAVYLAAHGCEVTLLDYSDTALQKAERLAAEQGAALHTIHADLTTWQPSRTWQALTATYVHLPVQWQPRLYEIMKASLAPGGTLVAEWFRPEQRTDGYASGGPPHAEMMVTAQELRNAFPESGIELLTEPVVSLHEGPGHSGQAAVVRLIWTKPDA
ncbi:MAG: class I SAM-dependent methyltransferase, partial [Longimonas sp.]|uniref:class I SAM-dependent methyltransferase n=1 Tax=Longimonas sp. TaxID=2039626 RepID=UPI0039758815